MQGLNISKLLPWKSLAFFLLSVLLLVWFIYSQDAGLVAEYSLDGVAVFPMVLLISFFYAFLQGLAWQFALGPSKASFWSLFILEASGNSLRNLSPFSLVGGDAVQGHQLLKKYEAKSGAESIITDRTVHMLALGIFVWVGLMVAFLNTPSLPQVVRIVVPALLAVIGIFCVVAIRTAKSGFFSALVDKIPTCGLPCSCKSPAVRGTLDEYDRLLLNFYNQRRGTFYQCLILHLICQGLMVAEVYLLGSALIPDLTLSWALLLAALAPLVSALFCFLPGAFGVMEMAFAGMLAITFGPLGAVAGIAIVLLRRVRAFCWIVVGLIFTGNPFKMFLGK